MEIFKKMGWEDVDWDFVAQDSDQLHPIMITKGSIQGRK